MSGMSDGRKVKDRLELRRSMGRQLCSVRGCVTTAEVTMGLPFGPRRLCLYHARLYRQQEAILARIRAL